MALKQMSNKYKSHAKMELSGMGRLLISFSSNPEITT